VTTPSPAAPEPSPARATSSKKKPGIVAWIGLGLFMAGLIMLLVEFRALFGSDVGGKCDDESGCKPNAVCISKRCFRSCKTDGDCVDGWRCGNTTVSETPGGNASKGFAFKDLKICFSPEKLAPQKQK
jgi:hypothetical protein